MNLLKRMIHAGPRQGIPAANNASKSCRSVAPAPAKSNNLEPPSGKATGEQEKA